MKALQDVFGGPSSNGFGNASFVVPAATEAQLDALALARYQDFVGAAWSKREDAWRAGFREVYRRPAAGDGGIEAALHAIPEPGLRGVAGGVIDDHEDPAAARAAMVGVFDAPDVRALRIYALGDGEAMSGIEVAALRDSGEAVFLLVLLD